MYACVYRSLLYAICCVNVLARVRNLLSDFVYFNRNLLYDISCVNELTSQ